jgi:MipA family protein
VQAENLANTGGLLVNISRLISPIGLRLPVILCGLSTTAFAAAAGAAELPQKSLVQERVISVSLFSFYGPKYLGAERYGPFAFPAFDIRRLGEPFALDSPDDGLGYPVLDTPRLKLGPVVSLRQGRNAGVEHRFTGLDPDPWAIEAGAFADYWILPERLRTRAELRHGLRGRDGLALDLSADLFTRQGAFTLSAGPRLGLLNATLAQVEFGVSPAASQRNGFFVPYHASGGLQSVGLSSSLSYDWSPVWRTTFYSRYDHLTGDAAASSITRRLGAVNQFTAGLGITYSFRSNLPFLP